MDSRIPINDKECEDVVIGSLLTDKDVFSDIQDMEKPH